MGQQSNLNKFNKIEAILTMISDHNNMKLGINYKKKDEKKHKCVWFKQHATELNQKRIFF